MIYLKITKKESIAVADLFTGFNKMCRALWLNILISYAYSMSFYILADNPELTANEALTKSKEMMVGHKMDLFVLHLSFIGWYLLSGITFGIASIYVIPYVSTTVANFYNSIKE